MSVARGSTDAAHGELAALARRIADASPADETEVTVDRVRESFVRFAGEGPTQSADRERTDVAVRVRLAGAGGVREASATCAGLDERTTRRALERALELARYAAPDPDLVELGGPVAVRPTALEPATAGHGFEEKAGWVKRAVEACRSRGLAPAGIVQTRGLERGLASSAGREVSGATTRASFALTASSEQGAGWSERIAGRVGDLAPETVVEQAVEKAVRGRDPVGVGPGEYTVVLEPAAVSAVMLFASYQGFGAREVLEESSFLCGRIGERVFPDAVSIADDAGNALFPGLPFDGEGTPKERVVLVDRGRIGPPVTDRNTAARMGVRCTGHSLAQPNTHGPAAQDLVIAPGDGRLADLVAGVERGLLVTQFHYTNMIEPRELTLTGMTRNGTFLIERGEVRRPVRDLRFTQSLVEALRRVTAVGGEQEVAGALFDGQVVTPPLRVDGFRFTSATD